MNKYQDLSLFTVPKKFRGKSKVIVQLWWITQAILFKPSPQIMYGWRRFLLKLFGAKIGKNVLIRSNVTITYPWKVEIGDNSWVGDDCVLYSLGNITIGSNVSIAHKVYFNTGGHNFNKVTFDITSSPVVVKNECWITNDVYVAPGVTIGRGTVVGARSSVFKDLPAAKVCVGSPAVVIKDRISEN